MQKIAFSRPVKESKSHWKHSPIPPGVRPLNSTSLALAVGDGVQFRHVNQAQSWQAGVVYTVKAMITKSGPQQLFLNGQSSGSVQGAFQAAAAILDASYDFDAGNADYVVQQLSLQMSNGANTLSLAPNSGNPLLLPLILLPGGPAPWPAAFAEDPTQTTSITAVFEFAAVAPSLNQINVRQFDPYVDTYGQAAKASWPSKKTTTLTISKLPWRLSRIGSWPTARLEAWMYMEGRLSPAGWINRATIITSPSEQPAVVDLATRKSLVLHRNHRRLLRLYADHGTGVHV